MSMLMNFDRRPNALPTLLDRFFAEPMFAVPAHTSREGNLAIDLSEDEKSVIVRASLPGFKREEIDVVVDEGVLSISAQRSKESETKDETFHRRERYVESLSRRIALPSSVMLDEEADAELKDGVLTLRLPKTPEAQPRKLKIR